MTEDEIDSICEKFELHWSEQQAGPSGLCQFMDSNNIKRPYDCGLLVALATVDIERNWLHWDKYLNDHSDAESLERLLVRFRSLPTLQLYMDVFDPACKKDAAWTDLILSEAISRAHWGDAIGPAYYLHCFGTEIPANASIPRHRLRIHCIGSMNDHEPMLEVPLRGLVRIGRQRSKDQSGIGWEELPEGNRVIVADKFERTISREQLTIQILSPQLAVIHNCSSTRTMGGLSDSALESGQSRLVSFPFIIKLPGRKLVFE